ncbi:MAG: hypothetical protein ACRDQB_15920, partial [Thermocrispum sp.]
NGSRRTVNDDQQNPNGPPARGVRPRALVDFSSTLLISAFAGRADTAADGNPPAWPADIQLAR